MPTSKQAVGRRLRLVRERYPLGKQADAARLLGVDLKRYNNWELGVVLFPVSAATKLCIKTGVDLDYIYRGEVSGLPVKLMTLLEEAPSRKAKASSGP